MGIEGDICKLLTVRELFINRCRANNMERYSRLVYYLPLYGRPVIMQLTQIGGEVCTRICTCSGDRDLF